MARRTGISRHTHSVRKYLALIEKAKDQPDLANHKTLADRTYGSDTLVHDANSFQQLIDHFGHAQCELGKTGVTRQLPWQENILQHPHGFVYSFYCYHLSVYLKNRDLSMHLEYRPADVIMINFAGKKAILCRYINR